MHNKNHNNEIKQLQPETNTTACTWSFKYQNYNDVVL